MQRKKFCKCTVAIVMIILSVMGGSAMPPITGNVRVTTGMFYGQMNELVYEGSRKISELQWEQHFVPYVDFTGQLNIGNGLLSATVFNAFPCYSGKMRDYDWTDEYIDAVMLYSEHEAYFEKQLRWNVYAGYTFRAGKWSFTPTAGFLYRERCWTAVDGFTQYPDFPEYPWTPDLPKQMLKGNLITYEALEWYIEAGLQIGYAINNRWRVLLAVNYVPYIDIYAEDSHYLRLERFHDKMKGGMGGNAAFTAFYHSPNIDALDFLVGVGYKYLSPDKGTTSTSDIGVSDGLIIEQNYHSGFNSRLFYLSVGVQLYPQRLWRRI